jgi:hypothetical protein
LPLKSTSASLSVKRALNRRQRPPLYPIFCADQEMGILSAKFALGVHAQEERAIDYRPVCVLLLNDTIMTRA